MSYFTPTPQQAKCFLQDARKRELFLCSDEKQDGLQIYTDRAKSKMLFGVRGAFSCKDHPKQQDALQEYAGASTLLQTASWLALLDCYHKRHPSKKKDVFQGHT